MKMWCLAVILFVIMVIPATAEQVPITKLNVAPWLGPLKDEKDLAAKFRREKDEIARYIHYDLKKSAGVETTLAEAREIVNLMEVETKEGRVKESVIADRMAFKSMGWKSRGQLMRTSDPVLELGGPTEAFQFKAVFEGPGGAFEYLILKGSGSLVLKEVVKAEVVPPLKAEVVPAAAQLSRCQELKRYPTLYGWAVAGGECYYEPPPPPLGRCLSPRY